jgi:hypothetical protein
LAAIQQAEASSKRRLVANKPFKLQGRSKVSAGAGVIERRDIVGGKDR